MLGHHSHPQRLRIPLPDTVRRGPGNIHYHGRLRVGTGYLQGGRTHLLGGSDQLLVGLLQGGLHHRPHQVPPDTRQLHQNAFPTV